MRLAEAFLSAAAEEIKAALDGGKLVVYSTGRPPLPDHPVTRSTPLATFTFASPAFGPDPAGDEGYVTPAFEENPVTAENVGTPSFARAFKADGTVVADFSVGPGNTEIKLNAVSAVAGSPIAVTSIRMPLPPEAIEWQKTEFGHVFVTSSTEPHRKLSVRG